MKAYISIPGVRAVCCVSPIRDSQHAEAEARMIRDDVGERCGETGIVDIQHLPMVARFMLQEALAAFCDDGQEVRS